LFIFHVFITTARTREKTQPSPKSQQSQYNNKTAEKPTAKQKKKTRKGNQINDIRKAFFHSLRFTIPLGAIKSEKFNQYGNLLSSQELSVPL